MRNEKPVIDAPLTKLNLRDLIAGTNLHGSRALRRGNSVSWLFSISFLFVTLAIFPTASDADLADTQSTAEKSCQMAANPDECWRKLTSQTGTPGSFNPANYPLTSDMLGLSGPLSFNVRYDKDLALVLGVDYAQLFNEYFGINGKFTVGANERRANLTTGFVVTEDQRLKFTYEYLAQNQNFDFTSGAAQEWVDQHAVGGAYQYLLRHEIVHSLEINGYIIRANSKNLSDVVFNQTSNSYNINLRRIAGGDENTVQALINLLPLKNTALKLGAGYSDINYDTQYEANPAKTTLAYTLELAHVLTPKVKLDASIKSTASGREHNVGVSHILPKNVEVSVKAQYVDGYAGLPDSKNIVLNFTYPAPKNYNLGGPVDNLEELRNWIEKPVVYATRVLAIKDEKVQKYSLNASDWNPQTVYPDDPNQALRRITPISTIDNFVFNDPDLTVTFTNMLVCPSTHIGPCTLDTLGLRFDTSVKNQATLSSFADLSEPATLANAPYVITVTATATRPGLNPPLISNAVFKLNVVSNFVPPANALPIRFDLINDAADPGLQPQANVETGAGATQPLVNLTLMAEGGRSTNADFNTTQPTWQVANCGVTDAANNVQPTDKCLFRTRNSNGHLEAGDIAVATQVPINVTINGVTQQASVPVRVTGDMANTIKGAIAIAYTAGSAQAITNWDTAPAGRILSSYYGVSADALIAIDNDAFGPWQNAAVTMTADNTAPGWTTSGGMLNINNAGLMTGTAPTVDPTSNAGYAYHGVFKTASKAASARAVDVSFPAQIQPNFLPPAAAVPIRFDLINDAVDPGLQPQANVETGAGATQPLINLSLMVVGGRSTNATFNTTQLNWQIANCGVTDAVNNVQPTDKCLFRTRNNNNHLEASDISPAVVQVAINAIINGAAQPVNISVIVTGDSRNDIHGRIADAFTTVSSSNVNWNAATVAVASGYYGTVPSNNLILAIDGDSYNGWIANTITPTPQAGAPAWVDPASLAINNQGVMTGVAPAVAGNNNQGYTGTFNAQSKAATVRSAGVSVVFPITLLPSQWADNNGAIKFDTLAVDPADQINLTVKIKPTMTAVTGFTLGTTAVGNYNPNNWQILSDATGAAYLVRKANDGNIDATEVGSVVQVPISVTGTAGGSPVTSSTSLNITVNPDANVFYQYAGDGSAGSPASPIIAAAQYPTNDATEIPNTRVVFSANNLKPKVTFIAGDTTTTYTIVNDDAMVYNFPDPQRSYISYPDNQTVKFTYAPSLDLGDDLSLVASTTSANIQAQSKAHGAAAWGAMQGLNVQVTDLTVTTQPPSAANNNIQCKILGKEGVSLQRSIYYVTVPLTGGRDYYLKHVNSISTTTTANSTNPTRNICPGAPAPGVNYAKGSVNTVDSQYNCPDGRAYNSGANTNKKLPAVRTSGDGTNLLTFFITELNGDSNTQCTPTGGGSYPRINSPMTLSISSVL